MACHVLGAEPLAEPVLICYHLNSQEQTSLKSYINVLAQDCSNSSALAME